MGNSHRTESIAQIVGVHVTTHKYSPNGVYSSYFVYSDMESINVLHLDYISRTENIPQLEYIKNIPLMESTPHSSAVAICQLIMYILYTV